MNIPAPFSQNQNAFFWHCFDSWFNVAEGGKRGGKNVLITMAYCSILEKHPSKIHLIAGVSTSTARLNILDCDGYGMLNFFEGRCRTGQYQNRDCLYVQTPMGEKIVLVSGGGKDRDERLIKGNTYGTAYITEANECHPNFIQEVFDRTISSPNRKVFHDLNPKYQQHWYYDILKFHEQQQLLNPSYGYNYGHFTIADNMSISDAQLREILKTYDKSTVWYARDIKGERKAAEGLIYQSFANHTGEFLIDDPAGWCSAHGKRFYRIMLGVDFGGTKSHTAFKAVGITYDWFVVVLDEEHMDSVELDPDKLNKKFCEFVRRVQAVYGRSQTRADNEESVLIRGLQNAVRREGLQTAVLNALKLQINDRIKLTTMLMAQKRLLISRKCEHMIDAFQTAIYDPDKFEDVRLDDGTSDIDSLDAFEYAIEPYYNQLIRAVGGVHQTVK